MKTLGDKIFEFRMETDMSQETLAEILGIDRSYLCTIENDKRKPGKKTLYKLMKILKKS